MSPSSTTRCVRQTLRQTLLDDDIELLQVEGPVLESQLTAQMLESCLSHPYSSVGISGAYTSKGRLSVLAISGATKVLIIQFQTKLPRDANSRKLLAERCLCREVGDVFAFDVAPLALFLFEDLGVRVQNAVDIQSGCRTKTRDALSSIAHAIGDQCDINKSNIRAVFDPEKFIWDSKQIAPVVQRAWVSYYLSDLESMKDQFGEVKPVNMKSFMDEELLFLAKSARDSQLLNQMKPDRTVHSISSSSGNSEGHVVAQQSKFSNRMRNSPTQQAKLTVEGDRGEFTVYAKIKETKGKVAKLYTGTDLDGKKITSVTSVGPVGPTPSEVESARLLLEILQQESFLTFNPWVLYVLSGKKDVQWPPNFFPVEEATSLPSSHLCLQRLNDSQLFAIEHMLSHTKDKCVSIIQGPPGTGKTSVIAAFVEVAIQSGQRGIWLIAQSNVAVKNIAEKLASTGFLNWRLLVSTDFHLGWHEHLYSQMLTQNVIRSDDFSSKTTQKLLGDVQVILCTLSMIASSKRMHAAQFSDFVPVNTLVIDEASQIQVHDYLPVFSKFWKTIQKICFIGDDKQLPPHGAEQIDTIESIFEKTHFQEEILFLDIQYRMPPQIGDFISETVYFGKLKSNPLHPLTSSVTTCHFINVEHGREERSGTSFLNSAEMEVVVELTHQFQSEQRSFRIVTPYDAQRSAIEAKLKEGNLDWNDKCFNVDSFQGNEDDYIIISIVRSMDLGFLRDHRRVNVMLTRCKKGMIICSSRRYLNNIAASSLVATLANRLGEQAWVEVKDLANAEF